MSTKRQKIEALAFHPDTPENQAIAAFLKLRALQDKDDSTPSSATSERRVVIRRIKAQVLWLLLDNLADKAWDEGVQMRIKSSDEGLTREQARTILVTSIEVLLRGPQSAVNKVESHIDYLITRINEILRRG